MTNKLKKIEHLEKELAALKAKIEQKASKLNKQLKYA